MLQKLYRWPLLVLVLMAFAACEFEPIVDENLDINTNAQSAVVLFDSDEALTMNEGETISIEIESPVNVEEDITVQIALSGTAEEGTDYDIAGASGGSASIVLDNDPADVGRYNSVDLELNAVLDGIPDGDKTLTLTLSGASSASGGSLGVGRGPLGRTVTVTIVDVDCESDLAGMYDFAITGDLGEGTGEVEITELPGLANYEISDFAAGAFGEPISYPFSVACGVISAPEDRGDGILATITGTADEATKMISMDVTLNCCGGEGFVWNLALTPK